jgi:hypothetical protein
MSWWFKEHHSPYVWPVKGTLRTFYDSIYKDIYFTPISSDNALCYSE